MRVAVLADCHIDQGHHGYWAEEAWWNAVKFAKEGKVDALLIAGDMFKDGKPVGGALRAVSEGMADVVGAGCEVLMILGNHELIRAGGGDRRWPTAMILGRQEGVRIVATPQVVTLNSGLQVAALPWPDVGEEQQPLSARRLADSIRPDGPRLLLGHADVTGGAVQGSESELPVVTGAATAALGDIDVPDAFTMSLLGHIHIRHAFSDTCSYVGSLEALGFHDEGRVGGFSVLEWDDGAGHWRHDFKAAGVRSFSTVTLEEVHNGALDEHFPGTLMRVRLMPGETYQMVDRDEFTKRDLRLMTVQPPKKKSVVSSGEVWDEDIEDEETPSRSDGAWRLNVWEHLNKWMEESSVASDMRPLLRDFCEEHLGWTKYRPTVQSGGWDGILDDLDGADDERAEPPWDWEGDDERPYTPYPDMIETEDEDDPLPVAQIDDIGIMEDDERTEPLWDDATEDSEHDSGVLGWAVVDAADEWILGAE